MISNARKVNEFERWFRAEIAAGRQPDKPPPSKLKLPRIGFWFSELKRR